MFGCVFLHQMYDGPRSSHKNSPPVVYLDFLGLKYKKSRGLLFTRFVSSIHINSTTAV